MEYRAAGLCALPAIGRDKRPSIAWKKYQSELPAEQEIAAWFGSQSDSICIVTGKVSGNLELLDFDGGGELFESWFDSIPQDLRDSLVVESSQSGGKHVIYRCEQPVDGNLKLAQATRDGKQITLIETRGEGGLFLCSPSTGYELLQGELTSLPILTRSQRHLLLSAAWALNEQDPEPNRSQGTFLLTDDTRPGDRYNEDGNVVELLKKHGWKPGPDLADGNQHWTRPGKPHGTSATLKDRVFFVFSSNAAPFESQRAYSPFSVYTLLEHDGDFAAASSALRNEGFGHQPDNIDVDLSGMLCEREDNDEEPHHSAPDDPGPMPDELLHVPGFISELMAFCLETAPYPNEVMAFCGALTLQAFLAGRKVRDPGDNRTNLYLLGLAHSAAGKDWPRKVNIRVLHEVGLADCLGERFASGEGIQDALFLSPSMLFQTDEIDGLLQSINKSRDARHENIMSTLLTMYSSANSVFPMRRKAGKEPPGVINQPSLVIFGTAIPNHYYEALSERMLTNGFFARMLILECGRRGAGQEPQIRDLPPRILEAASWWRDFQSGGGNLETHHPVPAVVSHTPKARSLLVEARAKPSGNTNRLRRETMRWERRFGDVSASRYASWRYSMRSAKTTKRQKLVPMRSIGQSNS